MVAMILSILLLVFTLALGAIVIVPVFFGAPWFPTSKNRIKSILEFCEAKPGEKLYDLGSGDGRVLIFAALHFGLTGVGLEIDPVKVWVSKFLINRMGVKDRVQIFRRSVYDFDYSDADILFIYLSHQALDRLFPDIIGQLKPKVKIVCYHFCLRGITPVKVSSDKSIFLYHLTKGNKLDRYS